MMRRSWQGKTNKLTNSVQKKLSNLSLKGINSLLFLHHTRIQRMKSTLLLRPLALICFLLTTMYCKETKPELVHNQHKEKSLTPKLEIEEANRLAALPLQCIDVEYPNKPGETLAGPEDIKNPKMMHPAFYGCFDWHSSVHGHWSLITLLKEFPELKNKDSILLKLHDNINAENVKKELEYFMQPVNVGYERTYGWAWLLKLALELHTWESDDARQMEAALLPLSQLIVERYKTFLPKLNYPIRVGEHTNTAFGLTFAFDYAVAMGDSALSNTIKDAALRFYQGDINCPMNWEPGGYDFLSPCLEEADLMRRILPEKDFDRWLVAFLPQLADQGFSIEPGQVSDRTDGKLVHLDGVNFSRAWCLYGIARTSVKYAHLHKIADQHIAYSLPSIVDENYEGTHWLGSFAIYALQESRF